MVYGEQRSKRRTILNINGKKEAATDSAARRLSISLATVTRGQSIIVTAT